MGGSGVFKRNHGGYGLHCFTKTHFISEQNFFLVQYVLYTPFLIAAKGAAQSFRIEAFVGNLFCQFLGKTVNRVVGTKHTGANIFKGIEKYNRVAGKIRPSL